MPDPHAKPGPNDRSTLLVAMLAGVVIGLLIFLVQYSIWKDQNSLGVVPNLFGGALLGWGAGLLLRRRRRR